MSREEGFCTFQIIRRVDAYGLSIGNANLNCVKIAEVRLSLEALLCDRHKVRYA